MHLKLRTTIVWFVLTILITFVSANRLRAQQIDVKDLFALQHTTPQNDLM